MQINTHQLQEAKQLAKKVLRFKKDWSRVYNYLKVRAEKQLYGSK